MDLAKFKIKAMRKSTIRRQGSTFDIDKINNLNVNDQIQEDSDELLTSDFETSSSNTIIDGEVVPREKPKTSQFTERNRKAREEE